MNPKAKIPSARPRAPCLLPRRRRRRARWRGARRPHGRPASPERGRPDSAAVQLGAAAKRRSRDTPPPWIAGACIGRSGARTRWTIEPPLCRGRLRAPASPEAAVMAAREAARNAKRSTSCARSWPIRGLRAARHRHQLVFADGNPHSRVMFVGEAPGYDEDITGRPSSADPENSST